MKLRPVTVLGFDADDTLWQNEQFYRLTEAQFTTLLGDCAEGDHVSERLLAAERRNLAHYGYGIKGFTLSMIETALEITEGRVPTRVIGEILEIGRALLCHPVECMPHARAVLEALRGRYFLVLITKGDLFDQERKLAQSGLGDFFHAVEIVSDKQADTYSRVFSRHGDGAGQAMMVGNSLKSDILPALEAGCWAVHVPHHLTWVLEHAEEPVGHGRYHALPDLGPLRSLVDRLVR